MLATIKGRRRAGIALTMALVKSLVQRLSGEPVGNVASLRSMRYSPIETKRLALSDSYF